MEEWNARMGKDARRGIESIVLNTGIMANKRLINGKYISETEYTFVAEERNVKSIIDYIIYLEGPRATNK